MKTGGLSENKNANEELRVIVNNLSNEILDKLNFKENSNIEIKSFKTQVVAGTIYFVKVKIDCEYAHLKILNYLPHENKKSELLGFKNQQEEGNEIIYF